MTFSGDFCDIYQPIPTDDVTPERVQVVIDQNNIVFMEECL